MPTYRFGDVVKKRVNGVDEFWLCVRPSFGPEDKGDSHWICYNAIHWRHETQLVGAYQPGEADERTPMNYLLNFTKDWTQHPKAFCRNEARKVPFNWTTRNVTSRELTFTDDGSRNAKCETVFTIGNR